jgi:hypothetical protein
MNLYLNTGSVFIKYVHLSTCLHIITAFLAVDSLICFTYNQLIYWGKETTWETQA